MWGGFVVVWLGLLGVLYGVGAVLVAPLARSLPDRGAAVAVPATLVIVWIGARFVGPVSITLGLLAGVTLLFATVTLARRAPTETARGPRLQVGFVLAVAFVIAVVAQWFAPGIDPTQTAALREYGILRGLVRAGSLPPEAVWFAGAHAPVDGTYLAALFARLTLTPTQFTASLWMAASYATAVAAAFGLGTSLLRHQDRLRPVGGLAAAIVVGVASPAPVALAVGRVGLTIDTATATTPITWLRTPITGSTMAIGVLVLAVGLLAAYHRTPADQRRRRGLALVGVGLATGVAAAIDPWTAPTILGLAGLTIAVAPASPIALAARLHARTDDWPLWAREIVRALATPIVSVAIAAIAAGVAWPDRTAIRATVAALRFDPGGIDTVVVAFAVVFTALAVYLWAFLRARWTHRSAIVIVAATLVWPVVARSRPIVAGGGAIAILAVGLARTDGLDERPSPGFEAVLIAAGALAIAARSVVSGPADTSLTTQAWVLAGIAAGPAVVRLATHHLPAARGRSWPAGQRALRAVVVASVLAVAITGPVALNGLDDRDRTLDVTAGTTPDPGVRSATDWLDGRPQSAPIVTAPRAGLAAVPAAISGHPTVVGPPAVRSARPDRYDRRVRDVRTIYTGSAAEQRELLRAYGVGYVIVGPAERAAYEVTLDDRSFLDPVAASDRWSSVTIYRVAEQTRT
ncbi:MAG: DUF2298 domain-containing protein [Halococcoides sp.]